MKDSKMLEITLKSGKDKPVLMGHPWIFNGAIAGINGKLQSGDQCLVRSFNGDVLATGYYNSESAIAIRVLSFGREPFDTNILHKRLIQAIQYRKALENKSTNSYRLINSEGDFLPGLIVDKFGEGLVVQLLTAGMERLRKQVIELLISHCKPTFIYDRSDTESRKREGLEESDGLLYGNLPEQVIVKENGVLFSVDIGGGQKTGFFFDQRFNRELLKTYAPGRKMCDCFSYCGAFAVNALSADVSTVECVDISKNAIGSVQKNVALNFPKTNVTVMNADVFKYLRETTNDYDLIVLDPPKFAKHPGEVDRAARGYKDINLVAMKKILRDGIIFTFSCSNAVDIKLFRQIVFSAAADSGRSVQVLHTLTAGSDHPVNIAHKEGEYLKGLVLRVV
jgi:23S rRNA (cytosine1962-C5)-methyltransferase